MVEYAPVDKLYDGLIALLRGPWWKSLRGCAVIEPRKPPLGSAHAPSSRRPNRRWKPVSLRMWPIALGARITGPCQRLFGSAGSSLGEVPESGLATRMWKSDSGLGHRDPDGLLAPVHRLAARRHQQNGQWATGALISAPWAPQVSHLSLQPLSQLADPLAALLAYAAFCDRRGVGIET